MQSPQVMLCAEYYLRSSVGPLKSSKQSPRPTGCSPVPDMASNCLTKWLNHLYEGAKQNLRRPLKQTHRCNCCIAFDTIVSSACHVLTSCITRLLSITDRDGGMRGQCIPREPFSHRVLCSIQGILCVAEASKSCITLPVLSSSFLTRESCQSGPRSFKGLCIES